jgi:alkylation response protein AidB-like acyl-CoA dehydrogenase
MADFGATELETFRTEVRDWLEANYPQSLRRNPVAADAVMSATDTRPDVEQWRKAMGEKGWGVPMWPKEYGGGGLSPQQNRVLQEEMRRVGAYNPIQGMGPGMFGHTLLEYGTHEQKLRHLIPISRGELRWCQGFSEPGAGSDLAGLQTKAEDKGDHFVINGQKIWTSGAQYADWCFCLVRTDQTKKHEGISFVLLPMHQPGVEVRPIRLIAGSSPFCETFFTDAIAKKEDLVGPLNGGWTIAKRLLQYERSGMGNRAGAEGDSAPGQARKLDGLITSAKSYVGEDRTGRIADADLRKRIIEQQMNERALRLTVARSAAESRSNSGPSAATSILKNVSMIGAQDRAELMLEVMGNRGLGWEGDGFNADELGAVRGWLSGKAFSIFGGSTEIQNNIISKRILGLPDSTQSS